MRALLITSPARSAELPDVPTAREVGIAGPDAGILGGRAGAGRHAAGDRRKLNAAINDTLRSPEMKESMAKLGFDPKIGSPQDFAKFIAEETPRWTAS